MNKFLYGVAALLVLATTTACSQSAQPPVAPAQVLINKAPAISNQTVPGSYIVTAPGDGATAIRRVFAQYGVVQVNPLGNNQFELRLQRDPGLDALTGLATGSNGAVNAIQPNFVYHAD
jgi:hypothetical protein